MSEPERSPDSAELADFANEGGRRERALMVAGVLLGTIMLATAGILVGGNVSTKQLNAVDWPGAPIGSIPAAVESYPGTLRRSSSLPSSPPSSLPSSGRPSSVLPPSAAAPFASRPSRSARRTTPPATTPSARPGVSTRPSLVGPGEPAASRAPAPVGPSTPAQTQTLLSVLPPTTDATAPEHTPAGKTHKPKKPRKP
ncbi:hypothetical protein [Nonomuraea sp. CA-141351]|uniref:hypothetical protein n=1 Tax=Nonomuraea sp. CA-141351 TaxID=3239996 RepID=UPI003D8F7307